MRNIQKYYHELLNFYAYNFSLWDQCSKIYIHYAVQEKSSFIETSNFTRFASCSLQKCGNVGKNSYKVAQQTCWC
jgi:hypothetical protein